MNKDILYELTEKLDSLQAETHALFDVYATITDERGFTCHERTSYGLKLLSDRVTADLAKVETGLRKILKAS